MTDLVYQTNLGGNLILRATNTASNSIVTIPATNWIEKESMQNGVSTIKLRLQEQMKALENEQSVALPWLPKTFTLRI